MTQLEQAMFSSRSGYEYLIDRTYSAWKTVNSEVCIKKIGHFPILFQPCFKKLLSEVFKCSQKFSFLKTSCRTFHRYQTASIRLLQKRRVSKCFTALANTESCRPVNCLSKKNHYHDPYQCCFSKKGRNSQKCFETLVQCLQESQ